VGALAIALEDLDGGRLARSVGAEEGEDLAPVDLEVDAADRLDAVVGLGQAADGDDGLGAQTGDSTVEATFAPWLGRALGSSAL
jgi:hypothetical protein